MTDRPDPRLLGLARDARRGRLSRRRFMQGALALGASVSSASALWASKVAAQTPKRGGLYRVGCHDGNTGDSLDPASTEGVYMIQLNHAIRSWLTQITNEDALGPDIAESWEASDDATEWRFRLARGAEFHDGKPFTAEDAAASLNHHRGEESKSAAKALFEDVEEIRAEDPHTLYIRLSAGNADLPYLLTDYHLVMLPSDGAGGVDWRSGVGTGPYKLVEHEPGVATEMARHPNWHGEGAWFDGVRMIALNDVQARQSALLTGEVDAITEPDPKTIDLMARNPGVKITEVPSGAHVTLPMFSDTPPFDDVNVRNALKLAIDRQAVVETILFGHGTIGNDQPIAPIMPFHADLPQREYDPEQARALLKKAGMEGLQVSLSTADQAFPGAVDLATLYAEHAKAAGIDIRVVREPNDGYWSDVWLKKPFVVVQWGQRPTPDVIFSLAYKAGAPWNESHWENARFNELLSTGKAELDPARRQAIYAEMQELVRDDGGTVIPFFVNRVNPMSARIGHDDSIAGNWQLDGARSFERWWFND